MRYIKIIACLCFCFMQHGCKQTNIYQYPPYGLIKKFSEEIQSQTGLKLSSFGATHGLDEKNKKKYGKANFDIIYKLIKNRNENISVEEARCLLISVSEAFLRKVNSDPSISQYTDTYPLPVDMIDITIFFLDHAGIELGAGVSSVQLWKGNIKYEAYAIEEYHMIGKTESAYGHHSVLLKESYAEALEIVKQQGCLKQL